MDAKVTDEKLLSNSIFTVLKYRFTDYLFIINGKRYLYRYINKLWYSHSMSKYLSITNEYKEYVITEGNSFYVIFEEKAESKILYVMCRGW